MTRRSSDGASQQHAVLAQESTPVASASASGPQSGARENAPADSQFGRYQLLAELARGGMGEVYVAEQRGAAGVCKRCVVKTLRRNLSDDPDIARMFLDEARLAAFLHHPNVVETYDVGEAANGSLFIAMELLEGLTLQDLRERLRGESVERRRAIELRVLCDVLAGLHHAHELEQDGRRLEVVHRDMSPHNVMVTFAGISKVLDFGIAKSMAAGDRTATGILKGKIHYMAPEQLRAEPLDRRADIFAVGIQLREALLGRRFWEGMTENQVMTALFEGSIPPIPDDLPSPALPPSLREVCDKATAGSRDDRFATANEMQEALEAVIDATPALRMTSKQLARWMEEHCGEQRMGLRQRLSTAAARAREGGETVWADAKPQEKGRVAGQGSLEGVTTPSAATAPTPRARAAWRVGLLLAAVCVPVVFFALRGTRPAATSPPAPVMSVEDRSRDVRTQTFTFKLHSVPEGAEVVENGHVVGQTPVAIVIDPASVAASHRVFSIRKEGYLPYAVSQGASASDVEVTATLQPVAPAAPPPKPEMGRAAPRARPAASAAQPPSVTPPASTTPPAPTVRVAPSASVNPFADRY